MDVSSVMITLFSIYTALSIACFALIGSTSAPSVASKAVKARPSKASSKSKDNIMLVIAHPDDEAMFFVPSIQHLKQYFHVHVLCLSNGGYDGLGAIREKELVASCVSLGLQQQHVTVLNDAELQDGMAAVWPPAAVARHVQAYVQQHAVQAVLTFDAGGVSGHPNHISTYRGVMHWAANVRQARVATDTSRFVQQQALGMQPDAAARAEADCIPVWTLASAPLLRKYAGVLDLLVSVPQEAGHGLALDALRVPLAFPGYAGRTPVGSAMLLTQGDLSAVHGAMVAHWSQYVWFRRLFVVFSRYSSLNSLQRQA